MAGFLKTVVVMSNWGYLIKATCIINLSIRIEFSLNLALGRRVHEFCRERANFSI